MTALITWHTIVASGFVATIVLTCMMAAVTGLGWSRLNLSLVLGTVVTADRERAILWGMLINLAAGWLISGIYAAIFETIDHAGILAGATLGTLHGLAVVAILLPVLPSIHPRMASEFSGPTPHARLEPPGFMGLNYGRWTPLAIIFVHMVYGALLGALL